jgi:hypothetical protein
MPVLQYEPADGSGRRPPAAAARSVSDSSIAPTGFSGSRERSASLRLSRYSSSFHARTMLRCDIKRSPLIFELAAPAEAFRSPTCSIGAGLISSSFAFVLSHGDHHPRCVSSSGFSSGPGTSRPRRLTFKPDLSVVERTNSLRRSPRLQKKCASQPRENPSAGGELDPKSYA